MAQIRELAVITGASTGIGFELAKCCAQHGYDFAIAADESEIHQAADQLRQLGVNVVAVQLPEGLRATVEGAIHATPM